MKIMMLSGDRSLVAGKRGAFYYTLEELSKYCERIDVLCPGVDEVKVREVHGNVYIHPGKFSKLRQIFYLAKKGKEVWDEHKHDIVLIHEYPPFYNSLGARLLSKKIKAKFVVEIHHIIGYPRAAGLKEKFHFWLSKIFIPRDCKRFDAVRIVNKKQVPEFLRGLGVSEAKLHYASSMYIDLDIFKPMDVEKKYDLVFAGRLAKNKNVEMLVEAVKILKERGKDVKCVIVGDGPEKEKIQLSIINYQLSDNIEFAGWLPGIEDVAKIYNQSRIFVMPSLNEGGPRVCLEAMACGVPVVTTRVGIMLDIIDEGKNGFFCDWSPEDMAEKILEIRNKEIEKLRDESRKTAEGFERRDMIKKLAEEYKKIVSGRNAEPQ